MNCPKCGAANEAGSRFCESCGADLRSLTDAQGWVGMGTGGATDPAAQGGADPAAENPLNPRPNRPAAAAAAAAAAPAAAAYQANAGAPTENPLNPRPVQPAPAINSTDLPPTDPNWRMAPPPVFVEEEVKKKRRWWLWAIGIILGACVLFCVGSFIFFEYTDRGKGIIATMEASGTQTAQSGQASPAANASGADENAADETVVPGSEAKATEDVNLPPTKVPTEPAGEGTPGA